MFIHRQLLSLPHFYILHCFMSHCASLTCYCIKHWLMSFHALKRNSAGTVNSFDVEDDIAKRISENVVHKLSKCWWFIYPDSTVCVCICYVAEMRLAADSVRKQAFSRAINAANRYCIVSTNFTFSISFIVIQLSKCKPNKCTHFVRLTIMCQYANFYLFRSWLVRDREWTVVKKTFV